ncbi:MAG: hypothetical protein WA063_03985 [Minisyncoccia bacterium]
MDASLISELVLSPGLITTLEKIEQLKKENKKDEAYKETIAALDMIRISGAILRWTLAEQCREKGDFTSAEALFAKAIEHMRKKDPKELKVIDAIKNDLK